MNTPQEYRECAVEKRERAREMVSFDKRMRLLEEAADLDVLAGDIEDRERDKEEAE